MSPPNSDDLFESGDFNQQGGFDDSFDMAGDPSAMLEQTQFQAPVAAVIPQPFSVYSVMLIISLVAMTVSAVLFLIESGKY